MHPECRISGQIAVKRASDRSAAPPFTDAFDTNHPHGTVEREGDHVTDANRMASDCHTLAV
jgi:hypothetical protein